MYSKALNVTTSSGLCWYEKHEIPWSVLAKTGIKLGPVIIISKIIVLIGEFSFLIPCNMYLLVYSSTQKALPDLLVILFKK